MHRQKVRGAPTYLAALLPTYLQTRSQVGSASVLHENRPLHCTVQVATLWPTTRN